MLFAYKSAINLVPPTTVQLNLNFIHTCRHRRVLAHLTCSKLQKLVCTCTVAHDFGLHMILACAL